MSRSLSRSEISRNFGRFRGYLLVLAQGELGPAVRGRVDPSDIVQETLLKAHQSIDQWRGGTEGELVAWLRAILANTIANTVRYHRQDKRDLRREIEFDANLARSSANLLALADAKQSSPDSEAQRTELLLLVAGTLANLPDDQREAFLAKHWRHERVDDIARTMDRTTASVAGLIRRSMQTLRDELGHLGDSTGDSAAGDE